MDCKDCMHVAVCCYKARYSAIETLIKAEIEIKPLEPFGVKLECISFVKNTHTRTPIFGAK